MGFLYTLPYQTYGFKKRSRLKKFCVLFSFVIPPFFVIMLSGFYLLLSLVHGKNLPVLEHPHLLIQKSTLVTGLVQVHAEGVLRVLVNHEELTFNLHHLVDGWGRRCPRFLLGYWVLALLGLCGSLYCACRRRCLGWCDLCRLCSSPLYSHGCLCLGGHRLAWLAGLFCLGLGSTLRCQLGYLRLATLGLLALHRGCVALRYLLGYLRLATLGLLALHRGGVALRYRFGYLRLATLRLLALHRGGVALRYRLGYLGLATLGLLALHRGGVALRYRLGYLRLAALGLLALHRGSVALRYVRLAALGLLALHRGGGVLGGGNRATLSYRLLRCSLHCGSSLRLGGHRLARLAGFLGILRLLGNFKRRLNHGRSLGLAGTGLVHVDGLRAGHLFRWLLLWQQL